MTSLISVGLLDQVDSSLIVASLLDQALTGLFSVGHLDHVTDSFDFSGFF